MAQYPWHEDLVRAFEACANKIAHPSSQTKKDQPALWMGSYLKAGKMCVSNTGSFSTLYPARVNASLADLSDGPLKDKKSISIGERNTEITESLTRESTALHSHLLWLTDLLLALTKRLEQPSAVPVVQPIIVKVLSTKSGCRPC